MSEPSASSAPEPPATISMIEPGGFSILEREGRAVVVFGPRSLADGVQLLRAEAVYDRLGFDASRAELARAEGRLLGLAIEVAPSVAARQLERALAATKSPITRLRLAPEGGALGVDTRLSAHGHSVRSTAELVVGPSGRRAIRADVIDVLRFGHVGVGADRVIEELRAAARAALPAKVVSSTPLGVELDILPAVAFALFGREGIRIPSITDVHASRAYVSRDGKCVCVFGEIEGVPGELDPSGAIRASARADAANVAAVGASNSDRVEALRSALDSSSGPSALVSRVLTLAASDASTFADAADLASDVLTTAPEGDFSRAVAQLALAEIADGEGRREEAAEGFDEAARSLVRLSRKRDAALSFLASALASRAGSAERAVEAAVKTWPTDPDVAAAEVGSLLARGETESAIVAAERVVTHCDELDRGPAHVLLGEALLAANEPIRAKRAFEKALVADPNDADALSGLARALEARGDLRRAAALYARLANATEELGEARSAAFSEALGDLWLKRDPEAAAARYRKALEALPKSIDLLEKLEVAARAARRPELLVEALDRAAALSTSKRRAELALKAAKVVAEDLVRVDRALDRLLAAANDDLAEVIGTFIELLDRVREQGDAATFRVRRSTPLVFKLIEVGKLDDAMSLAEKLTRIDTSDDDTRAELRSAFARVVRARRGAGLEILVAYGAKDGPLAHAHCLVAVAPGLAAAEQRRLLTEAAELFAEAGEPAEATRRLVEAAMISPTDPETLRRAVQRLVESGDLTRAHSLAERTIEALGDESRGVVEAVLAEAEAAVRPRTPEELEREAEKLLFERALESEAGLQRARRYLEAAEAVVPIGRLGGTTNFARERLERAMVAANEAASNAPLEAEPHRRVAAYARALDQIESELVSLGRLAEVTKDRAERVAAQLRRADLLRGPLEEPQAALIEVEDAIELLRAFGGDERARLAEHLRSPLGRGTVRASDDALTGALGIAVELATRTGNHAAKARAIERLLEIVDDAQERAELHVSLGEVLEWSLGEASAAERQYLAALALVSGHERALAALTSSYLSGDRFGDLAENLGVATLERVFKELKETGPERRVIAAAEALWPRLPLGSEDRGRVLLSLSDLYRTVQNEVDATVMLLEEVISNGPASLVGEALDRLRVLYLEEGRRDLYVEALRKNAERIEDDTEHALALVGIGEFFEAQLGNSAAAEREYRAALAVDANCSPARKKLATLVAADGRFAELGRDLGAAMLKAELERLLRRSDPKAFEAAVALEPLLPENRRRDLWREVSRLLPDASLLSEALARAEALGGDASRMSQNESRILSVREVRRESVRPLSEPLVEGAPEVTPATGGVEGPRVEPHKSDRGSVSPSDSFSQELPDETREWRPGDVAAMLERQAQEPEAVAIPPVSVAGVEPSTSNESAHAPLELQLPDGSNLDVNATSVDLVPLSRTMVDSPTIAQPVAEVTTPEVSRDGSSEPAAEPPETKSAEAKNASEQQVLAEEKSAAVQNVGTEGAEPRTEERSAGSTETAGAEVVEAALASNTPSPAPIEEVESKSETGRIVVRSMEDEITERADAELALMSWAQSDSTPPPWAAWSEPRALWLEPKLTMKSPAPPIRSFGRRALVLAALEVPDARPRAVVSARRLLVRKPHDAMLASRLATALTSLGDPVGALGPAALADFLQGRPSESAPRPAGVVISRTMLMDFVVPESHAKAAIGAYESIHREISRAMGPFRSPPSARPRRTILQDDPLRKASEEVARVAGIEVQLELLPNAQGAWVEPGNPFSLVIGDDLEVADPTTQRFVLGRAVIRARLGGILVDFAKDHLEDWLDILAGRGLTTVRERPAPMIELAERLKTSPERVRADLTEFGLMIDRAADRFGMIVAGRPARVLELVSSGPARLSGADDRLFALASFLASREHVRLLHGLSGYASHVS